MISSNGLHKAATREVIMAAKVDLRSEWVEVPGWPGGGVFVRQMTGVDRDRMDCEERKRRGDDPDSPDPFALVNYRARLLTKCLVNESGERIFRDDDAEWLGNQPNPILERLTDKALELNHITDSALEEAEKNSESGQSVDSGSA